MCPPAIDVYERCLLGVFQPVVCASSVRAAGTTGRKSFVSIHTRPTVTRDPPPELYRDVRDAYKTLMVLWWDEGGKRVKDVHPESPKALRA